jgi:RND family efflux transporter MFP subunit
MRRQTMHDSLNCERESHRIPLLLFIAAIALPTPLRADEPKPERIGLECRGYLVPASQITVSPKVAGQVVELLIDEGTQVKAGDILARLDPEEYKAALRLARARLSLAEAELAKAKEGARKADLAIAEAKVEVARAEVAAAQYRLDCAAVRAPIDGIVLAKRAEVGTRLDPRAALLPAGLCDMADLRVMEVEVWIPERDLGKVAKGQACVIRVDALPTATYRGRVARVQPVADRARAAVAVRVRLEGAAASERLRPELSAVVQFVARE